MKIRRAARVASRAARSSAVSARAMLQGWRLDEPAPRARAAIFQRGMAGVAASQGLDIRIRGALPAGPAILVANHVSYLDPVVIGALTPCAAIAKGEVASWPLIGDTARSVGVSFVDRTSAWSGAIALRRSLAVLAAGASVLNFPEGTTTDGSRLLPFRRGIFGLARLAGVPVVPIALRYEPADLAWTGNASFLPHYVYLSGRPSSVVHVDIAPALADVDAGADELARQSYHRIARLLRVPQEPHGPVVRLRVPPPRPDTVLPAAGRGAAIGE
jgi:1-acyl-sn-glycerol-3-phosphate acyltransferase